MQQDEETHTRRQEMAADRNAAHKRSFGNWVNHHLSTLETKREVIDLISECADGVYLMMLLEALTKGTLKYVKKPRNVFQKKENCNKVVDKVKKDGVKLENIGGNDLNACDEKLILGLIWEIILFYSGKSGLPEEGGKKKRPFADRLLDFFRESAEPYGFTVNNLTSDLTDGRVYAAVNHQRAPSEVPDPRTLDPENGEQNIRDALTFMEAKWGVGHVVDAEDLASGDQKQVITMFSIAAGPLSAEPRVAEVAEVVERAAPEVVESAAPEVVESAAPEVVESAAPEVVESAPDSSEQQLMVANGALDEGAVVAALLAREDALAGYVSTKATGRKKQLSSMRAAFPDFEWTVDVNLAGVTRCLCVARSIEHVRDTLSAVDDASSLSWIIIFFLGNNGWHKAHKELEAKGTERSLEWTFVHVPFPMEDMEITEDSVKMPLDERSAAPVALSDATAWLSNLTLTPTQGSLHFGRTYTLGGPEVLSGEAIAAVLGPRYAYVNNERAPADIPAGTIVPQPENRMTLAEWWRARNPGAAAEAEKSHADDAGGFFVLGGSSPVGRAVVRSLVANGAGHADEPVVASARTAEEADSMREAHPEARWIVVDSGDRQETLAGEFKGSAKLVYVPSVGQSAESRATDAATVAAAAEDANVRHVYVVSQAGASADSPITSGRQFAQVEEAFRARAPAWTVVRPAFLMESVPELVRDGSLEMQAGDARFAPVSATDVGDFVGKAGHSPSADFASKVVTLTGPQLISGKQIASHLGVTYDVEQDPETTRYAALERGVPEWEADSLSEMFGAVAQGEFEELEGQEEFENVCSRPMTTFGDFASGLPASTTTTTASRNLEYVPFTGGASHERVVRSSTSVEVTGGVERVEAGGNDEELALLRTRLAQATTLAESESARALQYQEEAERRAQELEALRLGLESASSQMSAQGDRAAASDQEIADLRARLVAATAEVEAQGARVIEFQTDAERKAQELEALRLGLESASSQMSAQGDRASQLQSELEAARAALRDFEGVSSERDALLLQLESARKEASGDDEALADLRLRNDKCQGTVTELEARLATAIEDASEAERDLLELQEELNAKSQKLAELTASGDEESQAHLRAIEELREVNEKLMASLMEKAKELKEAQGQLAQLEELRATNATLSASLDQKNAEYSALTLRLDELKASLAAAQEQASSAGRTAAEEESRIAQLAAELQSASDQLAKSEAQALQWKRDAEEAETLALDLEQVSSASEARVAELQAQQEKDRALLAEAEANLVALREAQQASESKSREIQGALQERTAQEEGIIAQLRAQLAELQAKLTTSEQQLGQWRATAEGAQSEVSSLQERLTASTAQASAEGARLGELDTKLEELRALNKTLMVSLKEKSAERAAFAAQVDELKAALAASQELASSVGRTAAEEETRIAELAAQLAESDARHNKCTEHVGELTEAAEAAQAQLKALREQMDAKDKAAAKRSDELAQLRAQLEASAKQLAQSETQVVQWKSAAEEGQASAAKLQAAAKEAQSHVDSLNTQLAERDARIASGAQASEARALEIQSFDNARLSELERERDAALSALSQATSTIEAMAAERDALLTRSAGASALHALDEEYVLHVEFKLHNKGGSFEPLTRRVQWVEKAQHARSMVPIEAEHVHGGAAAPAEARLTHLYCDLCEQSIEHHGVVVASGDASDFKLFLAARGLESLHGRLVENAITTPEDLFLYESKEEFAGDLSGTLKKPEITRLWRSLGRGSK